VHDESVFETPEVVDLMADECWLDLALDDVATRAALVVAAVGLPEVRGLEPEHAPDVPGLRLQAGVIARSARAASA
jgi:hypothetical protein